MIKHIKYISLLASIITLMASPAFASNGRVGVPVTAHTTLLVQNNTTGPFDYQSRWGKNIQPL